MVNLASEEKGILKYLGKGYDEAMDLDDITKYLESHGYSKLSDEAARERLDHLIDTGYVRSKTEGKGSQREEKFYLSKWIGEGVRKQKYLQGRGIIQDTSKLIQRLFGSIFILIGFGFLLYQSLHMTGAFISSIQAVAPTFVFALALFIIGGILLRGSFRNNFKKK